MNVAHDVSRGRCRVRNLLGLCGNEVPFHNDVSIFWFGRRRGRLYRGPQPHEEPAMVCERVGHPRPVGLVVGLKISPCLECELSHEDYPPPDWAFNLLQSAVAWWRDQGHALAAPRLLWADNNGIERSGGVAFPVSQIILVIAGKSHLDAQLTLLHELVHRLAPPEEGHGRRFWRTAWAFFQWANLTMEYCKERQGHYKLALAESRRLERARLRS